MKEVDVSLEDSPKKEATVGDGKAKVDEEIKEKVVLGSDGNNIKYKKVVTWNPDLVSESPIPRDSPDYEEHIRSSSYMGSPSASSPPINFTAMEFKNKVETVKGALGRWRKRVGEATKKAEDLAGNTWQHLKTSPSFTDAALGRIVHSTKVLAEGGYEKVFLQTFDTVPDETLQNSFACYLSTSVGPVMGVLYVSTEKLAYCSDNPVSYKDEDTTKWSYYKVTIPLHQLKSINPSTSSFNPSEKYIQVISVDNHEFWFMGFLNYTVAVTLLKEILEVGSKKSE